MWEWKNKSFSQERGYSGIMVSTQHRLVWADLNTDKMPTSANKVYINVVEAKTRNQHAIKFKYRTENNSRFVNVWMKNLVHESWKRQRGRLHGSWAKTTCIPVCDSKASYLLMVIWKGTSQEDLLAPSTRHPRTVLCTQKQTDESFFFLLVDVIFHLSCMPMNVNAIRY